MRRFTLGSRPSLADLESLSSGRTSLVLPPAALRRMSRSRRLVLARADSGPLYGVNTGFGELAMRKIPRDRLLTLQRNLILSHACGVGAALSIEESRAIVALRANEMARGRSGVSPALVRRMVVLAEDLVPVIPSRGSVGASGDLAPLAHAALPLIGEGEVWLRGRRVPALAALARRGLRALTLGPKEGIALINGTQAMQAAGGLALIGALRALDAADLAGAMSLEALMGTPVPFDAALHAAKPHPGQVRTAATLRRFLAGSEIRRSHLKGDPRVQDPYCLRCMPQVHGAARDALDSARRTVETEMRSVTDNPVVFSETGRILSGGNFHGQAMAFAFDFSAIALAALTNACERRVHQLVSDSTGILPPFLAEDPGIESGWMIAQVAAAALASENKTLAHPASVDTIPTSGSKEDLVSMGMGAALKLKAAVRNAQTVAAIELLAASEGLERRRPLRPGRGAGEGWRRVRALVPRKTGDHVLSGDIETVRAAVAQGTFSL